MRLFLLSFSAILLFAFGVNAQQRTCASHDVLLQQLAENPLLRTQREAIERHTENYLHSTGAHDRVVVTIPVVVNVVYNTTAQNISDAQIQSQIDVLNADFRKLNSDWTNTPAVFQGLVADMEVQFCLATQDPTGAATTGIRRRQTNSTSFSTNDAVKQSTNGIAAWDRNKYLNLWVCNLSGTLLGYAQFPGGAAATDGVVIDYQYFGTIGTATAPFNLGRTATHEVGHWLNLYHIWGDDGTGCTGSDQCADTPNQGGYNAGCPTFPKISCSNGPNGDLWMNYMDYSDDACMYMFTAGQKARAQSLFSTGGARVSLLTSPGCQPPTGGGTCAVPSGLNATGITSSAATLNWSAASGAVTYNLQWKLTSASTWTTVSAISGTSYNLSGLSASTSYSYQVQSVCSGGSSAYSTAASFSTTAAGGTCSDVYESNNTRNTAKTIAVGTDIFGAIGSTTDQDWFKFANTSTQRRIKVDLTNLPADYDIVLYRSSTQVGISENENTLDEQIILNTTTVSSNYNVKIYGFDGAMSTSQCYTLRVSLNSNNWRTTGEETEGEVTEFDLPVQVEQLAFKMTPNPATNLLTVTVPMSAENEVNIRILDPAGKVALEQNRVMTKGDNMARFELGSLSDGMYFVQVRNGDAVNTRKLMVVRQ